MPALPVKLRSTFLIMNVKCPIIALSFFAFLTLAKAQTDVHLVREGYLYGFKNEKNEWIIEPKYELFDGPYSDFMIAQNDQKLRGAINRTGDTLVPFEYQMIQQAKGTGFERDGKRIVFDALLAQNDQKFGLIDQKGQALVPFEFQSGAWVDDSTVFFFRPGRQVALNPLGQKILETKFDNAELFTDAFGKCPFFRVFKNGEGWSVADFTGKTILPFEFTDIRLGGPAGKTLIVTNNDLRVGVRDWTGKELVQPQYKWIRFLNDSLFVAPQANGPLLGLFDLSGRQRMPFIFTEIEAVGHSGRLKARKKGTQFGLFDAEGRELTFLELADFEANDLLPALVFAKYQDGRWAVLNLEGRHLHFPPLDSYYGATPLGFAGKNGSLSAFFLADGQRITPFQYAYANIFRQKDETRKYEKPHGLGPETWFVGWAKVDGEMRLIDNVGKERPVEPPPQKSPSKPKPADPLDLADIFEETASGNSDQKIYDFPEKQPQFPGGETAMTKFVSENLTYPAEAKKARIQGRVYVQFVVEKDGSLTSPLVMRDIGGGCGAAAVEVVKKMPRWSPAEHSGRLVRAKFTLPIQFKL